MLFNNIKAAKAVQSYQHATIAGVFMMSDFSCAASRK